MVARGAAVVTHRVAVVAHRAEQRLWRRAGSEHGHTAVARETASSRARMRWRARARAWSGEQGHGTASTGADTMLGKEATLGITARAARVWALADSGGG
jgi:hypothetical protein